MALSEERLREIACEHMGFVLTGVPEALRRAAAEARDEALEEAKHLLSRVAPDAWPAIGKALDQLKSQGAPSGPRQEPRP